MHTLREFLTPPIFPNDVGKTRMAANFFVVAKVSWLAVVVSTPILLPFFASALAAILYMGFMFLFPALMQLSRKGYPRIAGMIYGLVSWILFVAGSLNTQANSANSYIGGTLVMVMVMSLLLGRSGGLGFTALAIFGSIILALLKMNDVLPMKAAPPPLGVTIGHSVMLLTATAATYAATKNLAETLRRADAEIVERKRLEGELQQYTQQLERMVGERTAELRTAKEQIEVIIDHTRDGIALVRNNGDVQVANPAFRAMFAGQSAIAIESILTCVPEPSGVETLANGLVGALIDQRQTAIATRINSPSGGRRDVDLALVPISSEKSIKPSVVFSAHDITQFKELERLKERFVADAVHDLSTPISALAIRLHLLKTTPDQLEKHVHSLERQVEHLSHLLEDLQTLSRLDRGVVELERDQANLNTLVQRVWDTYEPIAADKQQRLIFVPDTHLPPCRVDARQIGRVIVNLVSNAIHYTHNDKTITMRTYANDGRVYFSIQDEGIGMTDFEREHAFDRFYRADQARRERDGGTGLGLAIVKEIIERHGGTVSIESKLGKGSRFTMSLPL